MHVEHERGLLDTDIMILRRWVDPAELLSEMAISAITLAELSAGPHEVRRNEDHPDYDEYAERARRLDVLQRAENEFDPIPFDTEAARIYGRICAAVIGAGRKPQAASRKPQAATTGNRPDDRCNRHCGGSPLVHDQPR